MLPKVPLAIMSGWRIALRLRQSLVTRAATWNLQGKWLVKPFVNGGGEVRICCCLVIVNQTPLKLGLLPSILLCCAYRRRLLAEVEKLVTF